MVVRYEERFPEMMAQAEVSPEAMRDLLDRLETFVDPFCASLGAGERRGAAESLTGLLSPLEHKTAAGIAYRLDQDRQPMQRFIGQADWDHRPALAILAARVGRQLGEPDGVIVFDPSAFAKKGDKSVGVARQWCGRLGKVDNCQVGVFLAYVTARGATLVDRRLYLSREWVQDRKRRRQTYVPPEVRFQEGWRIGLELLDRARADLPCGWVAGDDEFGRVTALRGALRQRGLRYVLDVPCDTLIRDLGEAPALGKRRPPWRRADAWAAQLPASRWKRVRVGDGTAGPKEVRVAEAWVQTKDEDGCCGRRERLVVLRTIDGEPRRWYALSTAAAETPVERVAQVHGQRHGVEEALQAGKGEVGLAHYEVRSWVGWHHHMTLSLLALWFLTLEKQRLGGKNPGAHGAPAAGTVCPAPATPAAERATDRRRNQPRATSQ